MIVHADTNVDLEQTPSESEAVMWLAAIGALFIGATLGVMGSGGSVLTVPVLTYFLGHSDKAAIAESLAIVGGIALVAAIPYARAREVSWSTVALFGLPGMLGAYLGAWLAGYVSGSLQLALFAVVLFVAAGTMLRRAASAKPPKTEPKPNALSTPKVLMTMVEGVAVGVVTGLVGVGGGFLIVPALVFLARLPMRMAVGTSLAVIALKSASGLHKYLDVLEASGATIDWMVVISFVVLGVAGSLFGRRVASQLNQSMLQRGFAYFLLVVGMLVIGRELPNLLA